MQRALSTHLFANHRLTTVWLERIWNAGIPLVEIFCARQHLDYRDKAQIAELGHWFRDAELKVHSLHSPMYNDNVWGRYGTALHHHHHRAGRNPSALTWSTKSSAHWRSPRRCRSAT